MSTVTMAGVVWQHNPTGGLGRYFGRGVQVLIMNGASGWRFQLNEEPVGGLRFLTAEDAAKASVDRIRDDALALLLATGVDALALRGKVSDLRAKHPALKPDEEKYLNSVRRVLGNGSSLGPLIRYVDDLEKLVRADERAKILAELPPTS